MIKVLLLLTILAGSAIMVGHGTYVRPDNSSIATHRKQAKPAPDCSPSNNRSAGANSAAPCDRTSNEGKGGQPSKAGSKVLFDRTLF
ncbi:MAG: hypothetical protein U0Y68_14415 [Blastocatellia bacterium]